MSTPPEITRPDARILHISDLHFGIGFDNNSWTDLCAKAKELKPNLLLVTGDLVNSPLRWRLSKALTEVNKLSQQLGCKCVVVPGNHDTRFFGVLPVKWIIPSLVCMGILAVSFYVSFPHTMPTVQRTFWIILFVLAILRICVTDFSRKFQAMILKEPISYPELGIQLFAFDSASHALFGARGKIRRKEFVAARNYAQDNSLYKVAILHHHPLPIPYDDAKEALMVADNAGAFLAEVSKLGVRLILHGHKHHRHFSRVTINANAEGELAHEIAVLSTGTPTAGPPTGQFGHNFNFLEFDDGGNMQVTPYILEGAGTFDKGKPYLIEQSELADKRSYEGSVSKHNRKCTSQVVMVRISADGDMHFRSEYHGFRVVKEYLMGMPHDTAVEVGTGHIDSFSGGNLDNNPRENIQLTPDSQNTLTYQKGKISFGRRIDPQPEALNFYYGYFALNAFAMSVRQFEEMYPGVAGQAIIEFFEIELKHIPSEELEVIIKFPAGFKLNNPPVLIVERAGIRLTAYEAKYENSLKYYPHLNVAVLRITCPQLLTYKLQWSLTNEPPPSGRQSGIIQGEGEEIAEGLLAMSISSPRYQKVLALLNVIRDDAQDKFTLQAGEQIDISLMAYNKRERALQIVAANFDLDDEKRKFKLKYGDGIAGRAYKMNKGRVFIKRAAIVNPPSHYYPIDGKPYDLKQVDEEVIISIPLRHPDNDALVYAVLNLSSKNRLSKLQDIKESSVVNDSSKFREVVNLTCYEALRESILQGGP